MGSSCENKRSDAMLRAYLEPIEIFLESKGPVQDVLNKVAAKSGISKNYVAAGSSMVICWLLFGLLAPLTISLIAFTYPAIQSIRSLEENQNQEKWLTYWVVYGVFNIVEFFGDILLSWFPLYFFIKTAFLIWCMAPIKLNGSIIIFKMIILPFFILHKEKLGKLQTKVDEEMKEKIRDLNSLISGGLQKYLE